MPVAGFATGEGIAVARLAAETLYIGQTNMQNASSVRHRTQIENVLLFCRMVECGGSMRFTDEVVDYVPIKFNQFAGLHLIATMFLIDREQGEPMGGFVHATLSFLDRAHLLGGVRQVLETPVGDTTLGEFLRTARNKLATHGDLTFASMPASSKSVAVPDQVPPVNALMHKLVHAVHELRVALEAEFGGFGIGGLVAV